MIYPQAKSLVSEFKTASQLLNPVSLLKFDAVEIRSSKEGECKFTVNDLTNAWVCSELGLNFWRPLLLFISSSKRKKHDCFLACAVEKNIVYTLCISFTIMLVNTLLLI